MARGQRMRKKQVSRGKKTIRWPWEQRRAFHVQYAPCASHAPHHGVQNCSVTTITKGPAYRDSMVTPLGRRNNVPGIDTNEKKSDAKQLRQFISPPYGSSGYLQNFMFLVVFNINQSSPLPKKARKKLPAMFFIIFSRIKKNSWKFFSGLLREKACNVYSFIKNKDVAPCTCTHYYYLNSYQQFFIYLSKIKTWPPH
jgi:hypothetical protein